MANSQAMCTSFKNEILQAYHNFGTTVTRASNSRRRLSAIVPARGRSSSTRSPH